MSTTAHCSLPGPPSWLKATTTPCCPALLSPLSPSHAGNPNRAPVRHGRRHCRHARRRLRPPGAKTPPPRAPPPHLRPPTGGIVPGGPKIADADRFLSAAVEHARLRFRPPQASSDRPVGIHTSLVSSSISGTSSSPFFPSTSSRQCGCRRPSAAALRGRARARRPTHPSTHQHALGYRPARRMSCTHA